MSGRLGEAMTGTRFLLVTALQITLSCLLLACADRERVLDLERQVEERTTELQVARGALAVFDPEAVRAARACNELQVSSHVRAIRGTSCDDYAAELGVHVGVCVAARDDAARYAEAVRAGQEKCAAFCRERQCPGPVFTPEPDCTLGPIGGPASTCPQGGPQGNCPIINACSLLNLDRVFNCACVES